MDYSGEPKRITRVLISARRRQESQSQRRDDNGSRGLSDMSANSGSGRGLRQGR